MTLRMLKIRPVLSRLAKDEEGVTLVEYGIAIGLAVAVGAPTLVALAGTINGSMTQAGGTMP